MSKYYNEIIMMLWGLMPIDAKEYIFECTIYPTMFSNRGYWKDTEGLYKEYSLNNFPAEKLDDVFSLISRLRSELSEDWTHCQVKLNENGEFYFNFAYIDEEDSWNMLYMKGISDLTWEEAQEYYIPREIWEERVRLKNSQS